MSKGTTPRAIRVEDELWEAAKIATRERGETISDVVRVALNAYVRGAGGLDNFKDGA